MVGPATLTTPRLLLRPWRDADLEPFAAMNADPVVMEHFPALLDRAESDATAGRIRRHFDEHGFGMWAAEVAVIGAEEPASFIGFIGLMIPSFDAHFTPCVEIGWRLARAHWGRGYATEGAREAVRHAFVDLGLAEVVAMTVPGNVRSRRVMDKLGMRRDAREDFDHPRVPEGSPIRRHVLYRLAR